MEYTVGANWVWWVDREVDKENRVYRAVYRENRDKLASLIRQKAQMLLILGSPQTNPLGWRKLPQRLVLADCPGSQFSDACLPRFFDLFSLFQSGLNLNRLI